VPFRRMRWYVPLVGLVLTSMAIVVTSYFMPRLGRDPIFAPDGAIGNWFNVDEENNLPTWWGTTLLASAALAHLWAGWVARRTAARGSLPFTIVAVVLLAMSIDEASQLHESLDLLEGTVSVPYEFNYFWLVFGIPLAVGVLIVALLAGLRLPRLSLTFLLLGFLVFFLGAVGVEVLGADVLDQGQGGTQAEVDTYHVEEALEMLGASLLVIAPLAGMIVTPGRPVGLSLDVRNERRPQGTPP
jgi:hypothetical protein